MPYATKLYIHIWRVFHGRYRAHRSMAATFWRAVCREFRCDLLGGDNHYRSVAFSVGRLCSFLKCCSVTVTFRIRSIKVPTIRSRQDVRSYGFSPCEFREIKIRFNIDTDIPLFLPRYNIAPSQQAPVIANLQVANRIELFQWGLVPWWAKDPSIGNRMINARAETLVEKPSFRDLLRISGV